MPRSVLCLVLLTLASCSGARGGSGTTEWSEAEQARYLGPLQANIRTTTGSATGTRGAVTVAYNAYAVRTGFDVLQRVGNAMGAAVSLYDWLEQKAAPGAGEAQAIALRNYKIALWRALVLVPASLRIHLNDEPKARDDFLADFAVALKDPLVRRPSVLHGRQRRFGAIGMSSRWPCIPCGAHSPGPPER